MSVTGLAIIYIIIWWIVFFAILPIDVDRIKIKKIEGEDPGSPENPKMLKKFIYCTEIGHFMTSFFSSYFASIIAPTNLDTPIP